ncbi:MAG: membrane protein insertase YidC [Spirochaetaceae bacterium]|nr:membrane protein insertase YidC [Spirochaetaceae bacterium]
MEKNTVWAIVLSTLVLVVFSFLQIKFFPVEQVMPTEISSVEENITTKLLEDNSAMLSPTEDISEEEQIPEEHFVITTEKAKITFTNRGGDIIGYEFIDHKDGDVGVEMAENIQSTNRAFALAFGDASKEIINEIFAVKKISDYSIGFYRTFQTTNSDGTTGSFVLAKQYTFKPDDYMFKLDITIDGQDAFSGLNFNNSAYTLRTSPQIGPYYDVNTDRYEYRKFMSYTDGKKKNATLSAGQTKVYNKDYSWTGVAGKYFEIIGIPQNSMVMQDVLYSCAIEEGESPNSQVMMTRGSIDSKYTTDTYYFYVGPRTEQDLKIYNKSEDNPWGLSGLKLNDSLESTGLLYWLEAFLKWCLVLIHKIIPNWGIAIIVLTIFIKILLYPITKKSTLSTLKMQEVQPRMQEIQTKYKDQPEKMNMELAKLYKETGYNPLSGCLPLLIQFPLIFAMYNLFNNYFEFRGAMFIPGWIPDLSKGDSVYTLSFNLPFNLGNQIRLLPFIYVVSQIVFSKITQTASTGANGMQMKIIMYVMPVMFFFIFYNAPAGLLIYWTVSNALQLVQQVILNRIMKAKREEMEQNKGPEKKVFVPKKKK